MPSAGGGSTSAPSGPVLVGREGGPTDQETHNSINAMRGRGAPLPAPVRERMEGAFGADLGAVRIHTDQRAAGLSHSLLAKAFTVGRDMFFGAGSFRPIDLGLLWMLASKFGFGRLPGDILVRKKSFTPYLPIASSLLVSVVLTLLFNSFRKKADSKATPCGRHVSCTRSCVTRAPGARAKKKNRR